MSDSYNLNRFVSAQNPVFDSVLAELRQGQKRSHWMWYIFPQCQALAKYCDGQADLKMLAILDDKLSNQ